MWCLERVDGNDNIYLIPGKVYSVGRKAGDLVLVNDQSVSRKHAGFEVSTPSRNGIVVWDAGSKFGTYINDGIASQSKLEKDAKTLLKEGGRVRFGLQDNIYMLKKEKLLVCASKLNAADKSTIKSVVTEAGGKIVDSWTENCTHLSTHTINLTYEILCALLLAKPIVTPSFWLCFRQMLAGTAASVDPAKFMPALEDRKVLGKQSLCLPNSSRKTLLKDKIFLFSSLKSFQEFKGIVTLAGGKALELAKCNMSMHELWKPHVLVVECLEDEQTVLYKKVLSSLQAHSRRMIPQEDIPLAIWKASVDVHCNPAITATSTLRLSAGSETELGSGAVLVKNTEDEDKYSTGFDFTDKVIPPTLPNGNASTGDETCSINFRTVKQMPPSPGGGSAGPSRKRTREEMSFLGNAEKKTSKSNSSTCEVKTEPQSMDDEEDLFALEYEKAPEKSSVHSKSLDKTNEVSIQSSNVVNCEEGFLLPSPVKRKKPAQRPQIDDDDMFDLGLPARTPASKTKISDNDFGFLDSDNRSDTVRRLSEKTNANLHDASRDLFEPTQESNISLQPSTSTGKRKVGADSDSENPPPKRKSTTRVSLTNETFDFAPAKPKCITGFLNKESLVKKEEKLHDLNSETDELAMNLHAKVVVTSLLKPSNACGRKSNVTLPSTGKPVKNFKKFRKSWAGSSQRNIITPARSFIVSSGGQRGRSDGGSEEEDEDNPFEVRQRPQSNRNGNGAIADSDDEFALPSFSQM